jgi:NTE family protein
MNKVTIYETDKTKGWLQSILERVREFGAGAQPPAAPAPKPQRPKVGLALGGGFARGISHLGVLRTLQSHGIPIDCIAGTSAGALAGVAYCSGLPFETIVKEAAAIRFGNFGQWRLSRMGLASNRRLETYPKDHFGVADFSNLTIPMAIAATDLMTGQAVFFTEGPVGPPLRASCAYPGLFQPVEYENHLLVDGFVSAAVPVDGARLLGAEVVIAVFLEAEKIDRPHSIVDVIGRSFSIVRLQADAAWRAKADVVITPSVHEFAWDDFARTTDLVAAGEQAALESLPRIEEVLRSSSGQPRPSETARGDYAG